MDKEIFILNEKIKFDKFNEETEKEFQKRYNIDSRIDEYFLEDQNSSLINEEKKKKTFLFKICSPIIDLSKRFYSSIQLIYEPKLYHFSFFLTTLWAYKNIKCVNTLLKHKYNDIFYQIIRPDSLNSRNKAFKILVLGGLAIPVSSFSFVLYDIYRKKNNSCLLTSFDATNTFSERSKTNLMPYSLHRRIRHNISNFKDKFFFIAKDFAKDNNLKKLSAEYHKNADSRMKWLNMKKGM